MKIEINKDFEEKYKSTYKGLTVSEGITAFLALSVAGFIAWAGWYFLKIPVNISIYIGMPCMILIVIAGFYKYQGAGMLSMGKELLYLLKTQKLSFEAEEYKDTDRIFTMKRSVNRKHGGV